MLNVVRTRSLFAALLVIAVPPACATSSGRPIPPAPNVRGEPREVHPNDTTHTNRVTTNPDPGPVNEAEPVDICAQFDHDQQNALSAAEHERVYGCPPCPCGCVNGEIVCAPCAVCESFGPPSGPELAPKPGVE